MQQKCFRSFCMKRDDCYARFVIILPRSVTTRAAPICNSDESHLFVKQLFQSWFIRMCIFQVLPVKIWSRGPPTCRRKTFASNFFKTVGFRSLYYTVFLGDVITQCSGSITEKRSYGKVRNSKTIRSRHQWWSV